MAIRFSDDYNRKIYNVVRNFNRKIKRLESKGISNLPEPISTRELKTNYQSRQQMNKQLNLYSKFGERDAVEEVETSGGAKAIKWELEYYKANTQNAIDFFEREIEKSRASDSEYRILRKDYQNNLQSKINLLQRSMNESTPKVYTSQVQIIEDYLHNVERMRAGYRNWMEIVNKAGSFAGVNKKVMKELNAKLSNLTEQQFTDLYHNEGLVRRIFELQYQAEKEGDDPEDIKALLEALNALEIFNEISKL